VQCVPSSSSAHGRFFSSEVWLNGALDAGALITEFSNVNAGEAMPSDRPAFSGSRAHARGFCHLKAYLSEAARFEGTGPD
jgi:hypothetical protein